MTTPRFSGTHAAIFWVGSLFAGGLNYLFNVVMARDAFLGPEAFGVLAAFSAVLYLDGIFAQTFSTAAANALAFLLGRSEERRLRAAVVRLSRAAGLTGVVLALFLLGVSPALARFWHLPSSALFLWVALLLPLTLLLAVATGALQGLLAFGALAGITVVSALLRFLFALPLVRAGHGVSGALLATVLGVGLAYVLALILLRHSAPGAGGGGGQPQATGGPGLSGPVVLTFLAIFGVNGLFALDLILAKHFLPAAEAGLYSGLATLGRAVYFLSFPVTMLAFPRVAQAVARGESSRRVVAASGAAVVVMGAAATLLFLLLPRPIIAVTLGEAYLQGSALLWRFGLWFAVVSLATWLLYLALASRRWRLALLPLLAVLSEVLFLLRFHRSPADIVTVCLAVAAALVSILGFLTILPGQRVLLLARSADVGGGRVEGGS